MIADICLKDLIEDVLSAFLALMLGKFPKLSSHAIVSFQFEEI
jgi:hypothetical protein